jgi:hypothetical protein
MPEAMRNFHVSYMAPVVQIVRAVTIDDAAAYAKAYARGKGISLLSIYEGVPPPGALGVPAVDPLPPAA